MQPYDFSMWCQILCVNFIPVFIAGYAHSVVGVEDDDCCDFVGYKE